MSLFLLSLKFLKILFPAFIIKEISVCPIEISFFSKSLVEFTSYKSMILIDSYSLDILERLIIFLHKVLSSNARVSINVK